MDVKALVKEAIHEMKLGAKADNDPHEAQALKTQIDALAAQNAKLSAERDALKTENDTFKAEKQSQADAAITAARERAHRAAIAKHGPDGAAEVTTLKSIVDGLTDHGAINALAASWENDAKKDVANPARQTAGNNPAIEGDDALVAQLKAEKEKGEKANKTEGTK